MKFNRLTVVFVIFSLLIVCCNTAYAKTDSENVSEYEVLREYIDTVEDVEDGITPYSDSFTACKLSLSSYDDHIHIYFSTGYSRSVSQIGMYNFKLQKKVWYGWTDVFSRSELSSSNASFCSRGYDLKAEHGETYRLKGTHFVVVGGTVKTLANTTPEFKYK